jgi:hypothetical protein
MRIASLLPLPVVMISVASVLSACNSETHEGAAIHSEPGLGPRTGPDPTPVSDPSPASTPVAEPSTGPAIDPDPDPTPDPDPELDERKLALANVGRGAFDALSAGKFAALLELTPIDEGPLHDACPGMPTGDRRELEARFDHCHETIDWDAVGEAQVFAGQPSGAPAPGCEAGIEDYGRLQLFLHMTDKTLWRVDFFGAVGRDGNAVGINGEVSCQTVDEAPPLK